MTTLLGPSPTWRSDPAILTDIIELLKQADSPDTQVQRKLAEAVGRLELLVDAPCYFCSILVDEVKEAEEVRQRAGLLLKGRVGELVGKVSAQRVGLDGTTNQKITSDELAVMDYVKTNAIRALVDESRLIRETAGIVLASIVGSQGVQQFPQVLSSLFQLLNHSNVEIVSGAFSALNKIIEDELDRDEIYTDRANNIFAEFCIKTLIPALLEFTRPESSFQQKRDALTALNLFGRNNLFSENEIFSQFFPSYWECLGVLALDQSSGIRLAVLQGMKQVTTLSPELVIRSLASIIPFLLECLCFNQPYEIRFEALELLFNVLGHQSSFALIESALPRLLPLLVDNAKYSQWDYMHMDRSQFEDDNAGIADEEHDLEPRFHKSRNDDADTEDGEDDEGAGNEMMSTWGETWTSRKWSARILDSLSCIYGGMMLPFLLPQIEARLQQQDWEVKESAVLVLGAVSRGCLAGLEEYLPKILEMLVGLCDHAKILRHFLDANKKVQQAACSAFATLEEEAGPQLVEYLPNIAETFNAALRTYQTKNLMVLFDAIGTLAESMGSKIDAPVFHEKVTDPLIQFWLNASMEKNNPVIITAFECLSCVVMAIPAGLTRYGAAIVQRCLEVARDVLLRLDAYTKNTTERPDRSLIECSFDLLSAVMDAIKSKIEPLIASTDLLELLEKTSALPASIVSSTVKQSAFALIGDLSEHCPNFMRPRVPLLVPHLLLHVADGPHNVCNNASWAIGQIALHIATNHELDPFASDITAQLIRVLQAPYSPVNIVRNAGITIGRLACASPIHVSQAIVPVFGQWCRVLEGSPNDGEKICAFKGEIQIEA
ncbi:transportin-1-like [Condylostylus longicornis]|uniref:transportin-1-like n=1 Tax=Condylostylus longicornis TaxID=2530218 RepID=UPI00244DD311|nr:transportin-1-like [Condylostylus longicornis]